MKSNTSAHSSGGLQKVKAFTVRQFERKLRKAFGVRSLLRIVVGTEPEGKEAFVICHHVNYHLDNLESSKCRRHDMPL